MTAIELKDIETRLSIWRGERHLTIEGQKQGLVSNILEELTEYSRSQNDLERIDSLCDIMVFTINSFDYIELYKGFTVSEMQSIPEARALAISVLEDIINRPYYVIYVCCQAIRVMGYNPYHCMLETLKEISSRTGHYDETIGKFVKDTSDEAKSKWYKADYSLCKK